MLNKILKTINYNEETKENKSEEERSYFNKVLSIYF